MIEGLQEPESSGVVYDLRQDAELLAQIAEASLSSGGFGLAFEHGIVGSSDWWAAVWAGHVQLSKFVGRIRRVDGGPMGDSAIVRIEGDGETKSWVPWEGFHRDLLGALIEVSYVRVRPKHPPRPGFLVELIVQVRLLDDPEAES